MKLLGALVVLLCFVCVVKSAASLPVYIDAIVAPFVDWSWASTKTVSDTTIKHSGTASYSFVPAAYNAVYFYTTPAIVTSNYAALSFWIYRAPNAPTSITVGLVASSGAGSVVAAGGSAVSVYTNNSFPVGSWVQGIISFSNISPAVTINGCWFQDQSGAANNARIYIDDVTFVGTTSTTTAKAATSTPTKSATTATTKAGTTSSSTSAKASTTSSTSAKAATTGSASSTTGGSTTGPKGNTTLQDAAIIALFNAVQRGPATYYGAYTNGGHCMLDPTPPAGLPSSGVTNTVAIVTAAYLGSKTCGMCISLTGTGTGSGATPVTGTRIVYVNNECPSCDAGGLDLGLNGDGIWDITWKAVPCPVTSNIQYVVKTGSSLYWLGLQVRNSKYPVNLLEVWNNGRWVNLPRQPHNYYELGFTSPALTLPLKIRVTSVYGVQVTDTITSLTTDVVIQGAIQF